MVESDLAVHQIGQNVEVVEDADGNAVVRNTDTGTEMTLGDFIDLVGPLGDADNPVPGTSHFDSVSADHTESGELSVNDPDTNFPDGVPVWIRAALGNGEYQGLGMALQGYDDGSAGPNTDKFPIRWWSRGLDENKRLATIVAHQTDNHLSFYTREHPVDGPQESNIKRLDIEGGEGFANVNWQNIAEMTVGMFDDSQTVFRVRSGENEGRLFVESGGDNQAYIELERSDPDNAWTLSHKPNNRLEAVYNGFPEFRIDPDSSTVDLRGNTLYGDGWQSRLSISNFVNLPAQDVTAISDAGRGDVAYHDGSGDAGEGIAYHDGSNWYVLDGGTQP